MQKDFPPDPTGRFDAFVRFVDSKKENFRKLGYFIASSQVLNLKIQFQLVKILFCEVVYHVCCLGFIRNNIFDSVITNMVNVVYIRLRKSHPHLVNSSHLMGSHLMALE